MSDLSDLRARQQLNRGYGESFSRGLELALVPVVFGGIGWLVDSVAGTYPACIIGFVVFGFAGIIAKMWLGYDQDMRRQEDGAVWNRGRTPGAGPATPSLRAPSAATLATTADQPGADDDARNRAR